MNQSQRWIFGALLVLLLAVGLTVTRVGGSASEHISAESLMSRLTAETAPLVLDVRSPAEYAAGHIPGATNLPYYKIPEQLTKLAEFTNDEIVIYCEAGVRAGIARGALEQAGFQQILLLAGNMQGWRAANLPVSRTVVEITP